MKEKRKKIKKLPTGNVPFPMGSFIIAEAIASADKVCLN
jgi:hypothetical protein